MRPRRTFRRTFCSLIIIIASFRYGRPACSNFVPQQKNTTHDAAGCCCNLLFIRSFNSINNNALTSFVAHTHTHTHTNTHTLAGPRPASDINYEPDFFKICTAVVNQVILSRFDSRYSSLHNIHVTSSRHGIPLRHTNKRGLNRFDTNRFAKQRKISARTADRKGHPTGGTSHSSTERFIHKLTQ